jgi:hypothetical protein
MTLIYVEKRTFEISEVMIPHIQSMECNISDYIVKKGLGVDYKSNEIVHHTSIKFPVDEKYVATTTTSDSCDQMRTIDFRVISPFIYYIKNASNEIILIGRFDTPNKN